LLLTRADIDPDHSDEFDQTALWAAAFHGHTAVVELLLATDGVNTNHKDAGGRTLLCSAAGSGHEPVVKLFLAREGVDPNCKDKRGQTPPSYYVCQILLSLRKIYSYLNSHSHTASTINIIRNTNLH
jgi:ankyrin repeat protein